VIINLITNAIKYSPQAHEVDINLSSSTQRVTIEVQDFGIGIAAKEQKRIFERFYQVIDRSGKSYPGLGMGLYLATEIIKQHHGRIAVKSEPGKGSTFTITLPIHQSRRPKAAMRHHH
jgi:signal transduction histidine kinase